MKKFLVITVLALFLALPATAATNNFTANGNITVDTVTFGGTTADMLIMDTSTAESWTYSSGAFTVTNPGTFKVGSSDSAVKGIQATLSGTVVACVKNSTAGTSYVTVPTTAGTYTVSPNSINIANSLTYNSSCGAATCASGYSVSGSGSGAGCALTGGGGPAAPAAPAPETPAAPAEKVSTTPGVPAIDSAGKVTLEQMGTDAKTVAVGDVNQVIAEMGVSRNATAEKTYNEGIVAKIVAGSSITAEVRNTINNFVTYGTKATKALGEGERAGVVNSFKAALGKLPTTEADWNDVIKIANGRWPSQISKTSEDKATINFKKVYLRDPNRKNANDDAAVTVMAYGLRPADRNLNSEKAAIKSFKAIYGYAPSAATAWDVVRAIAYSGSKR